MTTEIQETCSICLETIETDNKISNPCCKNVFCTTCIYKNISKGHTRCPLCRYDHITDRLVPQGQTVHRYIQTLQYNIYDLEFANNDLESTNDDLQSVNEDLQSANNKLKLAVLRVVRKYKQMKHTYKKNIYKTLFYKTLLLAHELLPSDDEYVDSSSDYESVTTYYDDSIREIDMID